MMVAYCSTAHAAMATARDVQAALKELLPTLDIDTTTERQIREQLSQKLGSVEEHKKLIKVLLDVPHQQP